MRIVRTGIIFLLLYPGLLARPVEARERGGHHAGRAFDDQKGRGNGHGPKEHRGPARVEREVVVVHEGRPMARPRERRDFEWQGRRDAWRDRDHCVVVVRHYYEPRGLPPGLARKHTLPPGLQRQLYERGHLPPGIERHWMVLPLELERDLPPLPPHHARRVVGGDLLIVDLRANVIVSLWPRIFGR